MWDKNNINNNNDYDYYITFHEDRQVNSQSFKHLKLSVLPASNIHHKQWHDSPSNVCINFSETTSNMYIIPSMAPQAMYLPSGLCTQSPPHQHMNYIFITVEVCLKSLTCTFNYDCSFVSQCVMQDSLHINYQVCFEIQICFRPSSNMLLSMSTKR